MTATKEDGAKPVEDGTAVVEDAAATVEGGATKKRGSGNAGVVDGRAVLLKGEATLRRVLPLTARPPPLLAAVLPWDRESGFDTEKRWDEVLSQWVAAGRGGVRGAPRTDGSWTEAHAENYLGWRGVSVEGLAAGDGAVQRKEMCSLFRGLRLATKGCEGLVVLTPLQHMGPHYVIQAQMHDVLAWSLFFQSITVQKLSLGLNIDGLHFKQWDPGGPFYFWQ
ncbi:hypothetical protein PIB30_022797 [Stylosanthes scabra]|uniref:Uncharacterized protein n=1 Tax=Stylosanthes scabra TaxID=79078 RepID=A0ABU6T9J6_9FABA|nr:hypothetical protein [Stylosanthes scabra]